MIKRIIFVFLMIGSCVFSTEKSLSLSNLDLSSHENFEWLADALKREPEITHLSLVDCRLDTQTLEALTPLLNTHLKILDLSLNWIKLSDAFTFLNLLESGRLENLQALDLSYSFFDEASMKAFTNVLPHLKNLHWLILQRITDKTCADMPGVIKSLFQSFRKNPYAHKMSYLDLSDNEMGAKVFCEVAPNLTALSGLQGLNMGFNLLGDEGREPFFGLPLVWRDIKLINLEDPGLYATTLDPLRAHWPNINIQG